VQNLSSEEQVQPLNIHDVSNSKNIQIDDEVTVEIHKQGTVTEIDDGQYYVQFWKDGYGDWFDRHEIED